MKINIRNVICIIAIATLTALCQNAFLHAQDYVKSDFRVSDLSDFIYYANQLSVSNTGDMVVVWETTGSGEVSFKTITSQGSQLSEQKLVKTPSSVSRTRVAHTDSGNFMIMYAGYDGAWSVFGQVYDHSGNEIGDTLRIQRNSDEMIQIYYSSLYTDRSNQFGAFLPGSDSMMVEKISGTGDFVGNTIVLKPDVSYVQDMTGLMTPSGNYIMVWLDGISGEIHGLKYTPEGVPVGESFQVNQVEEYRYIQDIAISCDTSGNFVVAWSEINDTSTVMYSQLYSADGISVSANTRITDEQSNINESSGRMSIGMDVDGKFVIAWADFRTNDTSFIYLQQMDNKGERVGGNYRATSVNNHIQGTIPMPEQISPSVKILRDTIYLTWMNYNQNLHIRQTIYANMLNWMPDITGIDQQVLIPVETNVYPNPSAGIFSLKMDHEYSGRLELEVFNAAGALVKRELRSWSGRETTIDLSAVPEGMYYLNIKGDSFKSTTKLIIIK